MKHIMETKSVIEFKLHRYHVNWEDTPVTHTILEATKAEAQAASQTLANDYQREVRWNCKGSPQGHYTLPEIN